MRILFFALLTIACGGGTPPPTGKMAAAGTVGAACNGNGDCTQTGASCVLPNTMSAWPGGYCTVDDCINVGCPDLTYCQQGRTGLGIATCLYVCTLDADCRTGYKCCDVTAPAGTGVKVCASTGVLCS